MRLITNVMGRSVLRQNTSRILQVRLFSCPSGLSTNSMTVSKPSNSGMVTVSMHKGTVNKFDTKFLREFESTVTALEEKSEVRGMILTSGLTGIFSAGLDISCMVGVSEESFKEFWTAFENMWKTYYLTPLVTVAAINGACPALGAVLAISSDYRIMANHEKFQFGLNETQLGLLPPIWLQHLTERTLGTRAAEHHLSCGSMMGVEEALDVGFVDELCDVSEIIPIAESRASQWLKTSQEARASCKYHMRKQVADYAGEDSLRLITPIILGEDFQLTAGKLLKHLQSRGSKNK